MKKVIIIKDEFYPFYYAEMDQEAPLMPSDFVCVVDDGTAARWAQTAKAFKQMQEELEDLYENR